MEGHEDPAGRNILRFAVLCFFSIVGCGGQNQTQNPIFGEDCVETIPPGFDDGACEEMPAPAQSGVNVFFCDTTVVVICPEGDEE